MSPVADPNLASNGTAQRLSWVSLTRTIRMLLGFVFLFEAFSKAVDSHGVRIALTLSTPWTSQVVNIFVGLLIGAVAVLGAALVLTRQAWWPLVAALIMIIAFSAGLINANTHAPQFRNWFFGGSSLLGQNFTLVEVLTRNGLLALACAALAIQSVSSKHHSHPTENQP